MLVGEVGRAGISDNLVVQFQMGSFHESAAGDDIFQAQQRPEVVRTGCASWRNPSSDFQITVLQAQIVEVGPDIDLAWLRPRALDTALWSGQNCRDPCRQIGLT